MSYKQIKSALQTVAGKYKQSLSFGYGTLNELNKDGNNYPLCWWVLPIIVTEQRSDENQTPIEGWPIILRFVDSTKFENEVDDLDNLYQKMKMIADGFMFKLAFYDDELTISNNITKRQLFRSTDDIHTGWEYSFTITYLPDVDNCCLPFNE